MKSRSMHVRVYMCVCMFAARVYALALVMLYPNVMYADACIISAGRTQYVTICTKKRRPFSDKN